MSNKEPPYCYICEKETPVDRLHYCLCNIAVCDKCVNSVKKNNETWICPKCKGENNVEKSMLFRMS